MCASLMGLPSDVGVSENSVPLNPMVLLIIIPITNGYFIGNINPTFSDKPTILIPLPQHLGHSDIAGPMGPMATSTACAKP